MALWVSPVLLLDLLNQLLLVCIFPAVHILISVHTSLQHAAVLQLMVVLFAQLRSVEITGIGAIVPDSTLNPLLARESERELDGSRGRKRERDRDRHTERAHVSSGSS